MEPRLLSGRASSVGELRRTWPFSSTKVEEAEPVRTGAVMVEGMEGGSNGGEKDEGGTERRRERDGQRRRECQCQLHHYFTGWG